MVELKELMNDKRYEGAKDAFLEYVHSQKLLGTFRNKYDDLGIGDDDITGLVDDLYVSMLANGWEEVGKVRDRFDKDALSALTAGVKKTLLDTRRAARPLLESGVDDLIDQGRGAMIQAYAKARSHLFDGYKAIKMEAMGKAGIKEDEILGLLIEYAKEQSGKSKPAATTGVPPAGVPASP